jgi:hypothetical protein
MKTPRYSVASKSTSKSRIEKLLDEFDETKVLLKGREPSRNKTRKYISSETRSDNRQEHDENLRKSHLNEVPTFLV